MQPIELSTLVEAEVHRPADICLSWLVYSHSYSFAVGGFFSFSVGDLQSSVTPEPLNALSIHRPSLFVGLAMGSFIAPSRMLQGKGT